MWSQQLFEDIEEQKIDCWTLHTNVKEGCFELSQQKEPQDEDVVHETQGACSRKAPKQHEGCATAPIKVSIGGLVAVHGILYCEVAEAK